MFLWHLSILSLYMLDELFPHCQAESQQTLRDLRLQFAEQISLLATKKESDVIDTLFRGVCVCVSQTWPLNMSLPFIYCLSALLLSDNRIESLIQKADQVLSSLSQRADGEFCPGGSAKSSTLPETPGSPSSSVTFSTPFILYPPFLSCTGSRTPTERRKYRTFKNVFLPKKKNKVFKMQHNYILRKMSGLKGKRLFYYCSLWIPAPLSHGESERQFLGERLQLFNGFKLMRASSGRYSCRYSERLRRR